MMKTFIRVPITTPQPLKTRAVDSAKRSEAADAGFTSVLRAATPINKMLFVMGMGGAGLGVANVVHQVATQQPVESGSIVFAVVSFCVGSAAAFVAAYRARSVRRLLERQSDHDFTFH